MTRPTGKGEYFCNSAGSIRTDVVATVASVGPKKFHTCARGQRFSSSSAVRGDRVSPQKRNRRTRGNIASVKLSSSRHICANDGVDTHVVTQESASAR